MVAVVCSVVIVIVLLGNFAIIISGLVFKVGSIGACQIC